LPDLSRAVSTPVPPAVLPGALLPVSDALPAELPPVHTPAPPGVSPVALALCGFDPVSCMLVCLFGERGLRCLGRSRPARLVIGSDAAACGFCPFRVGVSIGPREFGCFCPHGAYTLVVYDRCFLAVR